MILKSEFYKRIGTEVRNSRIQAGLTQEQLAEKAGIPRLALSNLEQEEVIPHPIHLRRVAQALKLPVTKFLPLNEVPASLLLDISDALNIPVTELLPPSMDPETGVILVCVANRLRQTARKIRMLETQAKALETQAEILEGQLCQTVRKIRMLETQAETLETLEGQVIKLISRLRQS